MTHIVKDGHTFGVERDLLEVTSLHRPDPTWQYTDAAGHVHQWHTGRIVATSYRPDVHYHIPTLVLIVDVPATEEYPAATHHECRQCGETIEPGYRADDHTQYIGGTMRYYVDDRPVQKSEFIEWAKRVGLPLPEGF